MITQEIEQYVEFKEVNSKKAIKDGRISQSQIENSYKRITDLKNNLEAKKSMTK